MKRAAYILSIIFALFILLIFYSQWQVGQKSTNTGPFVGFFTILTLIGGIGGILEKSWAKKVTIVSVGAIALIQIVGGGFLQAIIAAIVFGILFFAK